jgi:hypothetical protein
VWSEDLILCIASHQRFIVVIAQKRTNVSCDDIILVCLTCFKNLMICLIDFRSLLMTCDS